MSLWPMWSTWQAPTYPARWGYTVRPRLKTTRATIQSNNRREEEASVCSRAGVCSRPAWDEGSRLATPSLPCLSHVTVWPGVSGPACRDVPLQPAATLRSPPVALAGGFSLLLSQTAEGNSYVHVQFPYPLAAFIIRICGARMKA